MKHLVLGHARDPHAQHMLARLAARGHSAGLVQTQVFPSAFTISMYPGRSLGALRLEDGTAVDLEDIGSVYWRNFGGVEAESTRATRGTPADIAYYDSMACLRTWFQARNQTRWFNSWEAFQSHQEKPHQLALVAREGVRIPHTYVGNDPERILAFARMVPELIFKPVYGGSHTQRITGRHLAGEHLAKALKQAPITLQEFIDGTNVRTYAIGDQCFTAELHSDQVDFRADSGTRVVPIATPPELAAAAAAIMRVLGLRWTAIDWRRSHDGEYFFLEANPSPMFGAFERQSGYPITDVLIDAMTA
ncbi:RimK family alpha-L-glutamate ligase [Massilia sp. ST3]|uniref:ATP-grasp domain-containing protein n=1 Tax=Massilia sp. ST3 TaxID=2824903 RepID=UPI001B8126F9|nr:hypothetical protein [Massilia sp. ST3]MBQ5947272.1 hypothetical protein [Massilia sp. ST3]